MLRLLKKIKSDFSIIFLFTMVLLCVLTPIYLNQKSSVKPIVDREDVKQDVLKITAEDMRTEPRDERNIYLSTLDKNYVINEPGDYVLTGEFKHTIYIDVEEKIVHLFLDNVAIDSMEGAGIYVVSAAKVVITLLPDSVNYMVDAPVRSENTEEKATIMSNADLTINGSGELIVEGYYGDGIRTKDMLKILDASVNLQSKGDGIRGNDGILLKSKHIQIESEKNGVYTSDVGKAGKGTVKIESGTVCVIAGEYGILSRGDLIVEASLISGNGVRGLYYCEGQCSIEEGCINNE